MACPSQGILGENLTFTIQSYDGTGAPIAATGSVSYGVYEDETAAAILSGSMSQLAAQTGFYSEQIALTTANGFERFKTYTVRITATVSGISVAKAYSFLCVGPEDVPAGTAGALTTTTNFKSYVGITHTDDDTLIAALITRATSMIQEYCNRTLISDTFRERYGRQDSRLVHNEGGSMSYSKYPNQTYSVDDMILQLDEYPITDVAYLSLGTIEPLQVKNTSSDAYNASVKVILDNTDNSKCSTMTLTVSGGTNDGTDSLTLSSYTLTTLTAAINALGNGWEATLDLSTEGVWAATEILPTSGLECLNNPAYIEIPDEPESEYQIRSSEGGIYVPAGFASGFNNIIIKYTAGYTTTPGALEQSCIDLVNIYYRGRKKDLGLKSERLGDHSIAFAEDARDLPKSIARRLAPYRRWLI